MNMEYTYYLPDEMGNKKIHKTESNSIIIVGANGSGKSKLGAWMEENDMENVHRIGGQRKLIFKENIVLKSYEQAEQLVFYGSEDKNVQKSKSYRWDFGRGLTTGQIEDFEYVLAAIIALNNNFNAEYVESCKIAEREKKEKPHINASPLEKLQTIWDDVFPQRNLRLRDSKFETILKKNGKEEVYSSNQMSDGERSVLYLIAQVMCVPENKILIIDEPELHLHRSIMNRLWHNLEKFRSDCLFIYITHDTEFASLHGSSDKIWVKKFDGKYWEFSNISEPEMPEDLLFDILGSRKNVLFVEGESSSYDTQLYSVLYPNFHVVACGSCSQVIARVKAFKKCQSLHNCKVYGIIDLDYRSDHEIKKYKSDNIYTLEVAEVENLFLVEELIRVMAKRFGEDQDKVLESVKEYIVKQRFANQINEQVCKSVVARLTYQLSTVGFSDKREDAVKESLNALWKSVNYEDIKTEEETRFQDVLGSGEYKKVLRIFNEKKLVSSIGQYLKIDNKAYCSKVISLLRGELHEAIITALAPYLPPEIPRN